MSYLPLIDLKNGFWPVVHLLYRISEWNFTDMLNIKGYIFLVRTVTLTFPVHELSALDWSEKWFLTCSSFTIWSIWMKLHRYVDHQRLHIVTKDVISLSISVLLLFRHYISHKITFGAPSSGGVLRSACGAFIKSNFTVGNCSYIFFTVTVVLSFTTGINPIPIFATGFIHSIFSGKEAHTSEIHMSM